MATVASGVNAGRLDYGTLNFPLEQRSLDLRGNWKPSVLLFKEIVQNPYVGLSAGFIALCGAVAGLALAFTGSL